MLNWVGKSGKIYIVIRNKLETYAEGPLHDALNYGKILICEHKDKDVLNGFLHVIIATSNSSSEEPLWILGEIFICKLNSYRMHIMLCRRVTR